MSLGRPARVLAARSLMVAGCLLLVSSCSAPPPSGPNPPPSGLNPPTVTTSPDSTPRQEPQGSRWRLLGRSASGEPLSTAVATTPEQLSRLWSAAELSGDPSEPDWQREVVVMVVPIWSDACPIVLRGFELEGDLLTGDYDRVSGECGDDIRPQAFVSAVSRGLLPRGGFTLRAQAQAPGALVQSMTRVDVDLSAPNTTAGDQDLVPVTG